MEKKSLWDFPHSPVVKNPPTNAGDTSSVQVWKDPTCCRATKPAYHKRRHCKEKPTHHNEKVGPAHCNERKPACSNKDPGQPKINTNFKKAACLIEES